MKNKFGTLVLAALLALVAGCANMRDGMSSGASSGSSGYGHAESDPDIFHTWIR